MCACALWPTHVVEGPDDQGRRLVSLALDATARPDVSNLVRVHQAEGGGEHEIKPDASLAFGVPTLVFLSVEIQKPVTCSFVIGLDYNRYKEYMRRSVDQGYLSIQTEPPRPFGVEYALVLSFGPELKETLTDTLDQIEVIQRVWYEMSH
jgi:hypothetical protein